MAKEGVLGSTIREVTQSNCLEFLTAYVHLIDYKKLIAEIREPTKKRL